MPEDTFPPENIPPRGPVPGQQPPFADGTPQRPPVQNGQPPRQVSQGQAPRQRPAVQGVPPRPSVERPRIEPQRPSPAMRQPVPGRDPRTVRTAKAKAPSPARPPYYPSSGKPVGSRTRRRRRPTATLVFIAVIVVILIIIIVTSNSFKNCVGGAQGDTGTAANTDTGSDQIMAPPAGTEGTTAPETDAPDPAKLVKIFIDPGHGFGDKGSGSEYLTGYTECEVTLLVSQEIVNILKNQGYDAYLTHNGKDLPRSSVDDGNDLFSALDERPTYINENGGGLVISLHCDSNESETVSGTRIHYCDDNSYGTASADLSEKLLNSVNASLGSERAMKTYPHSGEDAYNITRLVNAPAAMIEMGFISNKDDAALLLDPAWRTKLANGISDGIISFLEGYAAEP